MTIFFIIVICVVVGLLVGWMIKSQHARDEELANDVFAKRVRGREGECDEKEESEAPESQNEVRRPLLLYDSIDDEEPIDDEIDY